MGKGIIGTVTMLGTVALAASVALFGLQQIGEGKTTLGVAFVGFAVLMVVVEEYIMTPGDIPAEIAARTADRLATPEDADEATADEATADEAAAEGSDR